MTLNSQQVVETPAQRAAKELDRTIADTQTELRAIDVIPTPEKNLERAICERAKLELDLIAENLEAINSARSALRDFQAEMKSQLDAVKLAYEQAQRDYADACEESARLETQCNVLDVARRSAARGDSSSHFEKLFDRLCAPQAMRSRVLIALADPVLRRRAYGTEVPSSGTGLVSAALRY